MLNRPINSRKKGPNYMSVWKNFRYYDTVNILIDTYRGLKYADNFVRERI
jgi:hypothetical protein